MPLLLELFSGTGSVGRAFRAHGWGVFSVDIEESAKPTLVADVLHLQPEQLPPNVDLIWASPPCTHYSRARTKAKTPRDLEGSDALVRKVLELVDHYMHIDFFMENPHSGLLRYREVVAGIPMQVVDYCKYGKPYSRTESERPFGPTPAGSHKGPFAVTTALPPVANDTWLQRSKATHHDEVATVGSHGMNSIVFHRNCATRLPRSPLAGKTPHNKNEVSTKCGNLVFVVFRVL